MKSSPPKKRRASPAQIAARKAGALRLKALSKARKVVPPVVSDPVVKRRKRSPRRRRNSIGQTSGVSVGPSRVRVPLTMSPLW